MKKRIICILMASILCGTLMLTGCGKKETPDAVSVTTENKADGDEKEAKDDVETDATSSINIGTVNGGISREDAQETTREEGLVDRRTDIQKYWNGDWYGWLGMLATGEYDEFNDTSYDTCGRIEVDENGDGTLTLWYGYDDGDTFNDPTGIVKIHIDDTIGEGSHGTLISTGGWMFVEDNEVDEGEMYVKPDEVYSPDCLYIRYKYVDEHGSLSPLFALRPWGYTWEDDSGYSTLDGSMPAFFKWYTPLIEDGWALPDDFKSEPVKTMKEREIELIELAAGQSTPIRSDTDIDLSSDYDSEYDDDAYYNDSTDFENELGSSKITHGFDKDISNPKITGSSYAWGNLEVNIPDGMEAKNGGIADKNDKNSLQAVKGTKYFIISQRYELDALEDVESTIEMNDADEVCVTVDGTEWEGAYYEYSGTPVWQIYATVDDACIEVMAYGYDFDSAEAQTILATAKSTTPIWE